MISVIVPVYKVEQYLDKCVESLVNQSYRDLEIILVDDGSPDNCGAMCDAWAQRDSRIKVIHKENGGVSSARNIGLDVATGAYVCFVDSDDQVDAQFVQLLYWAALEQNASISVCRMRRMTRDDDIPVYGEEKPTVYCHSISQGMQSLINGGIYEGGVCDKLYKRDVIGNLRFHIGRRHEDEFFTHSVFDRANCLVYVDAELYYYLQHEDSFMHTVTLEHLDMLEASLERLELVERHYPELLKQAKASFCVMCVSNYRMVLCRQTEGAGEFTDRIKAYRRKVSFGVKELLTYGLKDLAYILCSAMWIDGFARFLNYRRGGI